MIFSSRWDYFEPRVRDRRVLDIGPAELVGTVNRHKMGRWLHGRIRDVASSLVGLEASAEQTEALRDLGYDIRQGDAERFRLDRRFDVVVAGELIEHLSSPGALLDRAAEHLEPGGTLLLTTPNRFSVLAIYRVLRTGKVPVYDKDLAKHVAYFDSDALSSLLERHGYEVLETAYCRWVGEPSRSRTARALVAWAARWRPAMLPTLLMTARPLPATARD